MWVVSPTTRPLYPRGNSLGTHRIGGWVGSKAGLDALLKPKISSLMGILPQLLGRYYTNSAIRYGLCIQNFRRETWRQESTRLPCSTWEDIIATNLKTSRMWGRRAGQGRLKCGNELTDFTESGIFFDS
jgi:hypothetical protein